MPQELNGLGTFHAIEDPHLSLSRVLTLRHHWIEDFIATAKTQIAQSKLELLTFEAFKVFINEEKTRTFIGIMTLHEPQLNDLVRDIDENVLSEYKLPPFYDDPEFHVSLVWILGGDEKVAKKIQAKLDNLNASNTLNDCDIDVNQSDLLFQCKSGNKLFSL